MRARSPVLGYNHNVRYAGRIWHVQTEDSGVTNPHIFTHLFHNGTILATKRVDYDPSAEVVTVQKLMQQQHKAMLRELKAGSFDEKIGKFFGEVVTRDEKEESTDPSGRLPLVELDAEPEPRTDPELQSIQIDVDQLDDRADTPVDSPALPLAPTQLAMQKQAEAAPPRPPAGAPPTRPQVPAQRSPAPTPPPTLPMRQPRPTPVPRPAVGGIGGLRRPSQGGFAPSRPSAEGVVVARPAVIIGGDPQRASTGAERRTGPQDRRQPTPPPPAPTVVDRRVPGAPEDRRAAAAPPGQTQESIFGADLISEKSLDEVILAYLSEDLTEK